MTSEKDSPQPGGPRAVASQDNGADSAAPSKQLPNSRKVYVNGRLHADLRVPFREISLAPTKSLDGTLQPNEPVRVYDTSGPWGDAEFTGNVEQGLPPLHGKWIRERGDVEEIEGRLVRPQDNGWLSEKHRTSNIERRKGMNESARRLGTFE